MINLIPKIEKKEIYKEFCFRIAAVFFIMLGVSFLVASVAILPSYFLVSVRENFFNSKLETQKNEPATTLDQNALLTIKELKGKLTSVEKMQQNKAIFSQRIINEIILKKLPGIKITEISYGKDPQKGEKIDLSGRAPNREVLLAFRQALEGNGSFSKVDLPISNFVKGSNIKFFLSLTPVSI